jgi:hypothetical protein
MLGGFPCPDAGRASQEADTESGRMPGKRKADDEGFQHPNAKKPKLAEESSEELHPPYGRIRMGAFGIVAFITLEHSF